MSRSENVSPPSCVFVSVGVLNEALWGNCPWELNDLLAGAHLSLWIQAH